MAHIILKTPNEKRYYIEIEDKKPGAYSLTPSSSKGLINTLRDNEDQVIQALFVSDCESRSSAEIAKDLGVKPNIVRTWKFEFTKRNRTMMRDKYETLKKVYGIDTLIK